MPHSGMGGCMHEHLMRAINAALAAFAFTFFVAAALDIYYLMPMWIILCMMTPVMWVVCFLMMGEEQP